MRFYSPWLYEIFITCFQKRLEQHVLHALWVTMTSSNIYQGLFWQGLRHCPSPQDFCVSGLSKPLDSRSMGILDCHPGSLLPNPFRISRDQCPHLFVDRKKMMKGDKYGTCCVSSGKDYKAWSINSLFKNIRRHLHTSIYIVRIRTLNQVWAKLAWDFVSTKSCEYSRIRNPHAFLASFH